MSQLEVDPDQFRVKPGKRVHLADIDPNGVGDFKGDKSEGKDVLNKLKIQLDSLQELMYASQKGSLLVILQGMDTSGKDGTIKHVFDGVNPQGIHVANFKVPTAEELAHDFLWRIHQQTPGKGEIVIFNRSQYEDVLVVRVHKLVPEKVWHRRYGHINDFERLLTDAGTTVLKFYLHIDQEEQKQRLLDRLDQPEKHWKFNPADLKERALWDDYTQAYEDAIEKTSTDWAPWYIIPSNHKWFRSLAIASTIVKAFKKIDPQPQNTLTDEDVKKYREELQTDGNSGLE